MWKVTGIVIGLQVTIEPKVQQIKVINNESEHEICKHNSRIDEQEINISTA